jgi:hypothetical protein
MVKSTLNKFFNSSVPTKLEGTHTKKASAPSNRSSKAPRSRGSQPSTLGLNLLVGKAIVDAIIEPSKNGRVRFQGSWWSARCEQETTIFPGEMVRVVGRQNITLIVEPVTVEPVTEQAIEPAIEPMIEPMIEQNIEPIVKPMPFVTTSTVANTAPNVPSDLPNLN